MAITLVRNELANSEALTEAQIQEFEALAAASPIKTYGSGGPLSWDVDFSFDKDDITKSYALVKLYIIGIKIIDFRLDFKNPKLNVDMTVAGHGIKLEVGIDFDKRTVYIKGSINFGIWSWDYNQAIWSF